MWNYVCPGRSSNGLLESAIRSWFWLLLGARWRLQCVAQCEKGLQTWLATCNFFWGQDTLVKNMYVPKARAKGPRISNQIVIPGYCGWMSICSVQFWGVTAFLARSEQTCHFFYCTKELHFLRRILWGHKKSGKSVRSKVTSFCWKPLYTIPQGFHIKEINKKTQIYTKNSFWVAKNSRPRPMTKLKSSAAKMKRIIMDRVRITCSISCHVWVPGAWLVSVPPARLDEMAHTTNNSLVWESSRCRT